MGLLNDFDLCGCVASGLVVIDQGNGIAVAARAEKQGVDGWLSNLFASAADKRNEPPGRVIVFKRHEQSSHKFSQVLTIPCVALVATHLSPPFRTKCDVSRLTWDQERRWLLYTTHSGLLHVSYHCCLLPTRTRPSASSRI